MLEQLKAPGSKAIAPWGFEEVLTPHCAPEDIPAWSKPPGNLQEIYGYLFPLGIRIPLACTAKAFLIAHEVSFELVQHGVIPQIYDLINVALHGNVPELTLVNSVLDSKMRPPQQGHASTSLSYLSVGAHLAELAEGMAPRGVLYDPEEAEEFRATAIEEFSHAIVGLAYQYAEMLDPEDQDGLDEGVSQFYAHWWSRCMCTYAVRDINYTELE